MNVEMGDGQMMVRERGEREEAGISLSFKPKLYTADGHFRGRSIADCL